MNRCPIELWTLIFVHACTNDGGKTYGSLALVSRYFHTTSKPLRFLSIDIKDPRRAELLSNVLEREFLVTFPLHPPNPPKFRQLSLTDRHPDPNYVYGPADALKLSLAFERILHTAAPTLVSLTIDKPYFSQFAHSLVPGSLPALVELSITNLKSIPISRPDNESEGFSAPLPSLKRLHVHFTESTDLEWYRANLFDALPWIAPRLEVFHVEGMFWYAGIIEFIGRTIYRENGLARAHPSPDPHAPYPTLPGTAPSLVDLGIGTSNSISSSSIVQLIDDTETDSTRENQHQLSLKIQHYKSKTHIASFWRRLRFIIVPIPALHEYPSSYPNLSGQMDDATINFPVYMSKTAFGFMIKFFDELAQRDEEGRLIVIDGSREALEKDEKGKGWTGKLRRLFTPAHSRWT